MIYQKGTWEYKYAHRKIGMKRGSAKTHQCDCGQTAQHWAHIHDTCMDDENNYEALCVKCHYAYDSASYFGNSYSVGVNNSHSKLTEDQVREIRKIYSKGGITQREIADLYGVKEPAIYKIVSYRTWLHI